MAAATEVRATKEKREAMATEAVKVRGREMKEAAMELAAAGLVAMELAAAGLVAMELATSVAV